MPPEPNLILEIIVRGGAVGAFLGLLAVIARPPFSPARVTGALFCVAAAAHTLTQHPSVTSALGPALIPIWAFSVMGAGLFWAFTAELFGDHRRLEPIRFAPAALLLVVGVASAVASGSLRQALLLAHNLVSAAFIVHVFIVIWNGWRNDLVESRSAVPSSPPERFTPPPC